LRNQIEAVVSRGGGYCEIENHHVGAMHLQLLETFLISPSFRNHIEIRLTHQECPNAFADENVVINDDDVNQAADPKMPSSRLQV
jgi:hypothetical protein